jgi:uncharacterized Zn-finger protein
MDQAYTCKEPGCGKSFRKPSDLLAHKRWHDEEDGYVCEVSGCEMRFQHPESLKRHINTHHGEKPHECDVSKQSFSRLDELKKYRKIHSREVCFLEER